MTAGKRPKSYEEQIMETYGLTLEYMKEAAINYRPVVTKVDDTGLHGMYSVYVEDRNGKVCPMRVDFFQTFPDFFPYNEDRFYSCVRGTDHNMPIPTCWCPANWKAEKIATDYLYRNGIIVDNEEKIVIHNRKLVPGKIPGNMRENTVQPKPSAKTKETTKPRRRDRK